MTRRVRGRSGQAARPTADSAMRRWESSCGWVSRVSSEKGLSLAEARRVVGQGPHGPRVARLAEASREERARHVARVRRSPFC